MSRENVEVVRQTIALEDHPRRRWEERLGLRFPPALALVASAVLHLPQRSRLRQTLVRRAVRFCFEANNRRDFEAAFMLYHPDGESVYFPQAASLGLEPRTRGLPDRLRTQRDWSAEWGMLRFEIDELIDLRDQILVLTHLVGRGLSSGAAVGTECDFLFTISDGRVIHEQVFLHHAEALEAAGLRE
jgi:hypothetical protein